MLTNELLTNYLTRKLITETRNKMPFKQNFSSSFVHIKLQCYHYCILRLVNDAYCYLYHKCIINYFRKINFLTNTNLQTYFYYLHLLSKLE